MSLDRPFLVALGLILALPALAGHRPGPARRDGRAARPKLHAPAPRPSFDLDDPSAPVVLPGSDDDEDGDDDGGDAIGRAHGHGVAAGPAAWAVARLDEASWSPWRHARRPRRAPDPSVPIPIRC